MDEVYYQDEESKRRREAEEAAAAQRAAAEAKAEKERLEEEERQKQYEEEQRQAQLDSMAGGNPAAASAIEQQQGELDRRAQESAQQMTENLGGARTYFDENDKSKDPEVEQMMAERAQKRTEEKAAREAAADKAFLAKGALPAAAPNPPKYHSAPGAGVHTGQFVTQADFEAGRRHIEDVKQRMQDFRNAKNVARAAARTAAAERRAELLATGEFYDAGNGKIRRKKYNYSPGERRGSANAVARNQFRDDTSVRAAEERAYNDTFAAQLHNAQKRRQERAEAYTNDTIAANRKANQANADAQANVGKNRAKRNLNVFDGICAALDNLNENEKNGKVFEQEKFAEKDEKGRDARWKYDEQGRVIGQNDKRQKVKTGKKFYVGGVAPEVVKAINQKMLTNGEKDLAITGIVAQKSIDANGRATGEPTFYVQMQRGDGTKVAKVFTRQQVYRMATEAYEQTGTKDGEDIVINTFGDVFGKRANDLKRQADELALEEARKKAARGDEQYDLKVKEHAEDREHLKTQRGWEAEDREQKKKDAETLRTEHAEDREYTKAQRELARVAADEKNYQANYNNLAKREKALADAANAALKEGDDEKAANLNAEREAVSKQLKLLPLLRERAKRAKQGGAQGNDNATPTNAPTQGNDNATPTNTPTQGNGNAAPTNAPTQPTKRVIKTSEDMRKAREAMPLEQRWGKNVIERFREIHPDARVADINAGKFDTQLKQINKALNGKGSKPKEQILKDEERNKRLDEVEAKLVDRVRKEYGDIWKEADNYAVENHGKGIFRHGYEDTRALRFRQLMQEREKENRGISSMLKGYGGYDVENVLNAAFGDGAGVFWEHDESKRNSAKRLGAHRNRK